MAQVYSCEFGKFLRNSFFKRTLPVAAFQVYRGNKLVRNKRTASEILRLFAKHSGFKTSFVKCKCHEKLQTAKNLTSHHKQMENFTGFPQQSCSENPNLEACSMMCHASELQRKSMKAVIKLDHICKKREGRR